MSTRPAARRPTTWSQAYIGAGAHEGMALGRADPNEAVNSQVILEILRGDRELAADEYTASKSDLEVRSAELEASSDELQAAKDRQAKVVADLEASVARQTSCSTAPTAS